MEIGNVDREPSLEGEANQNGDRNCQDRYDIGANLEPASR